MHVLFIAKYVSPGVIIEILYRSFSFAAMLRRLMGKCPWQDDQNTLVLAANHVQIFSLIICDPIDAGVEHLDLVRVLLVLPLELVILVLEHNLVVCLVSDDSLVKCLNNLILRPKRLQHTVDIVVHFEEFLVDSKDCSL